MRFAMAAAAFASFSIATVAAGEPPPTNVELPAVCRWAEGAQPNWQGCYDATEPGSMPRILAAINLGSEAFLRGDYAAAVRFYDEGRPPGNTQIYSDVAFHGFRAAAYDHVGRDDDALSDARIALRMLHRDSTIPVPASRYFPEGMPAAMIYELILPVLKTGNEPGFPAALNEYLALPVSDFRGYSNRAAVLEQVGDLPRALEQSALALAAAPNDAGVQNNHCVILHDMHRDVDALPFCEASVRLNANLAASRDSLADVYAALRRCADASREEAEAHRLDPTHPTYATPVTCTPA